MVTNTYAAPLPEQISARAAGYKVFSSLDLRAGFHQLIPTEDCQKQLCFWNERKLMQYKRQAIAHLNFAAAELAV